MERYRSQAASMLTASSSDSRGNPGSGHGAAGRTHKNSDKSSGSGASAAKNAQLTGASFVWAIATHNSSALSLD